MHLDEYVTPDKHQFKKSFLYHQLVTHDLKLALAAMELAAGYHVGLRKDGITPEFDHQVSIGRFMMKGLPYMLFPDETLATAILHDVAEDYDISFADIKSQFGGRISRAVTLLTKVKNNRKRPPETYFSTLTEDPIASLVNGADRVHNQSTMQAFSAAKRTEYLGETDDWIIPMLEQAMENFPEQAKAYSGMLRILGWQKKST